MIKMPPVRVQTALARTKLRTELWEVDSDKEGDTTAVRPLGAPRPGFQPFKALPVGIGLAVAWSNVDKEDMKIAFQ